MERSIQLFRLSQGMVIMDGSGVEGGGQPGRYQSVVGMMLDWSVEVTASKAAPTLAPVTTVAPPSRTIRVSRRSNMGRRFRVHGRLHSLGRGGWFGKSGLDEQGGPGGGSPVAIITAWCDTLCVAGVKSVQAELHEVLADRVRIDPGHWAGIRVSWHERPGSLAVERARAMLGLHRGPKPEDEVVAGAANGQDVTSEGRDPVPAIVQEFIEVHAPGEQALGQAQLGLQLPSESLDDRA